MSTVPFSPSLTNRRDRRPCLSFVPAHRRPGVLNSRFALSAVRSRRCSSSCPKAARKPWLPLAHARSAGVATEAGARCEWISLPAWLYSKVRPELLKPAQLEAPPPSTFTQLRYSTAPGLLKREDGKTMPISLGACERDFGTEVFEGVMSRIGQWIDVPAESELLEPKQITTAMQAATGKETGNETPSRGTKIGKETVGRNKNEQARSSR
jgi:hypothetical protein